MSSKKDFFLQGQIMAPPPRKMALLHMRFYEQEHRFPLLPSLQAGREIRESQENTSADLREIPALGYIALSVDSGNVCS